MKDNNILVIAFKYNDIFYAINTEEFKYATKKYLIIFKTNNDLVFPFINLFDYVIYLKYKPKPKNILINILKVIFHSFRKVKFDYAILSNIHLVTIELILTRWNITSIVLVEDGLLNYTMPLVSKNATSKIILENLLNISTSSIKTKLKKSYFLSMNKSVLNGVKLTFKDNYIINKRIIHFLNNKKVFIGQNVYDYCDINVDKYCKIVNQVINSNQIDLYLPHLYSNRENIKAPKLELNSYSCTLEMLAPYLNKLTIYSFNSSLLYTLKTINNSVQTVMIKHNLIEKYYYRQTNYLKNIVDNVYVYNED